MSQPRLRFETTADPASFPATLATVNSALHFHPGALVLVACIPDELADGHWQVLASSARIVAHGRPGAHDTPARADDQSRVSSPADESFGDADVVIRIAPGCVLCSPIDDLVERCLRDGVRFVDSAEEPRLQLRQADRLDGAVEVLDGPVWGSRERHWSSIIDFRERRLSNLSAASQPQRMLQSGDEHPFWSSTHRDRVLGDYPLQTYPYVWFLAMLWFGRCRDWSLDPHAWLPEGSRHLLGALIDFLPQIIQVLPPTRYQWNGLTHAMIGRALDGVPRMLPAGAGMDDVMALVDAHPWIRRYVEIGSYQGGSILTLALRFLARDIDFYAVESFMGNLDGTTDGLPLSSRRRFLDHLARFPSVRVRLVPGDSAHAAVLFDDGSLDCVFIDACHATEAVLRDIDAWMSKLARPGIIAGDDYGFDSVFEAVSARFGEVNITQSGTIWWVLLP